MGKQVKDTKEEMTLDIAQEENTKIEIPSTPSRPTNQNTVIGTSNHNEPVSCLRHETIIVRYLPKESGMITNPKHILYGGMSETASRTFTVPLLRNKSFKNVLTDAEKDFLEEYMGLEKGALSVYKKSVPEQGIFNFWENYTVRLVKGDNPLRLSDPDDYIRYKVLLANTELIAPSLESLLSTNKVTYQFVIISENEETKQATKSLNSTMEAYKLLGKLEDDRKALKLIVEIVDGRPISDSSKIEFIRGKAHDLIQSNAKLFVSIASDVYLQTKVLITDAIKAGLISKRGDFYYLASDSRPLCEANEDPTLNIAAKYLNAPRNQEIKLILEAKLKSLEE